MLLYETPEIDSTNEWAWRLAEEQQWPQAPFLCWAYSQSAGKGTQGRRWDSPANAGIYVSYYHSFSESQICKAECLTLDASHVPCFTLAAGLATLEALRVSFPEEPLTEQIGLKPWNDLVVNSLNQRDAIEEGTGQKAPKKLGGILVETKRPARQQRLTVVTGMGMNWLSAVRSHAENTSVDLETLFTEEASLGVLGSKTFQRQWVQTLGDSLTTFYQQALASPQSILPAWQKKLHPYYPMPPPIRPNGPE
jgi:biotin-(acetyl-CoA carboxylase) ligase